MITNSSPLIEILSLGPNYKYYDNIFISSYDFLFLFWLIYPSIICMLYFLPKFSSGIGLIDMDSIFYTVNYFISFSDSLIFTIASDFFNSG